MTRGTTSTTTSRPTRQMPRHSRRWVALPVAALLLLSACGGGSSDDSGATPKGTDPPAAGDDTSASTTAGSDEGSEGSCGTAYASQVCATVSITGSSTVDGTAASYIDGDDCADWAQGEGDNLRLPLFVDGLTDGTPFGMQQLVTSYTGPGTYELDQLSGEGSSFTLVAGENRYVASPDGDATASLTIESDGSGSLTVEQFEIDSGSGTYSSPVDATVTWTCDDA